jgi:RNA polymerase sigma-70 factor (ECF subfamily)
MPTPPPDPHGLPELLAAARTGSREALGELLESYRRYLTQIARDQLDPRLLPKGDQSDLVQETFRDAQKAFGQFRGSSEEELQAWLRRILVHRICRFARRYRGTQKRSAVREVALDPGDSSTASAYRADTPTPSAEAVANEQSGRLQGALARLPEEYRQAILLRYRNGMSFEEIGRALGRSAEAARKLWGRAVERLREEMDEARDDHPE